MCAFSPPCHVPGSTPRRRRRRQSTGKHAAALCSPHPGSDQSAAPCLHSPANVAGAVFLRGRDAANGNPLRAHILNVCLHVDALRAMRGTKGKEELRPKKTILCVDDNEQVLAVRKFMLETRGYRVVTAQGAADALDMFRNGGIDLVLSDLIMPQMDGNEMVRRMKDITPDVPMILVSGTVKAFDRAGHADAFLPKGASTPVEVLERIRVMIARKRGPKKVVLRPAFAPGVQPAIAS